MTAPQTPTESSLSLWNPNAAALWSVLFTPAFGAFLHAKNAESLGRAEEVRTNRVWAYISLAFTALIFIDSLFSNALYVIPEAVMNVVPVIILLSWYLVVARKQIKYVKDTYKNNYQRKSWLKPILVVIGIPIAMFIAGVSYLFFTEDESLDGSETSVTLIQVPDDKVGYVGSLPEIYIEGEMNETILPKLKEIVQKNEIKNARVLFNSYGGDIGAATEIGQYLRDNNFTTDIRVINEKWGEGLAGECHSACTLAYIGGKYRFFDPASKFGVHRFYSPDSVGTFLEAEAETQEYSSLLIAYIRSMGVDVSMFNKMAEQSSDDLELLDVNEMRKINIVNDGALPPSWEYSIDEDGLALIGTQEILDQSQIVVIACNGANPIFTFGTEFDTDLKNVELKHSLRINDDLIDISDNVFDKEIDVQNEYIYVSFQPTTNQLLKILSGNSIMYSFVNKDDYYESRTDMSSVEDKKKISDFIQYCKS
jgi:ATP-dependent protease ClpP protease subunit